MKRQNTIKKSNEDRVCLFGWEREEDVSGEKSKQEKQNLSRI